MKDPEIIKIGSICYSKFLTFKHIQYITFMKYNKLEVRAYFIKIMLKC